MFVATINTPGYLPDAEPLEFETIQDAWDDLQAERNLALAENEEDGGPDWDQPMDDMERLKRMGVTGEVHGYTPGRSDSPHDLGLVYSVTEVS